jgi:tetratricopeptide (TPR) repeat protein
MLHLVEEKRIVQEDGRWVATAPLAEMRIPEGVREVIGRRLSRVGDTCGRMLTTASALTAGFSWDVIRALVDAPDAALLDAVDEALSAQLIVEREPARYEFTHALIRHTLYEELSTPRRLLLHRQIGETLERLYAADIEPHLAEVAHHFYESADRDNASKAMEYIERAARHASRAYAHEDAARLYRMALDVAETAAREPGDVCTVFVELAREQGWAGQPQDALGTFFRAVEIARSAELSELFVEAAIGAVGARIWAGGDESDHELIYEPLLREAVSRARGLSATVAIKARATHAWTLDAANRGDEASTSIRQTIADARETGDPELLAFAIDSSGFALWRPDNLEERISLRREELSIVGQTADQLMYAHIWLGLCLFEAFDIEDAYHHFSRAEALATKARIPSGLWYGKMLAATRATFSGEFDEAERLAAAAAQFGASSVATSALHFAIQLFCLRWLQGRSEELVPVLRAMDVPARNAPAAASLLAVALIDARQTDEAHAAIASLVESRLRDIRYDQTWLATCVLLAETAAVLGSTGWITVLVDAVSPYSSRCAMLGNGAALFGSIARSVALLHAAQHGYQAAESHFEDALAMNTRMGARPWIARTQLDYARMLLQRDAAGDRDRARELLAAALATANEIGMVKVAADCEAALEVLP